MRDPSQVQEVVAQGVDAIGMIFYKSSPRNITYAQAEKIRNVVPAFVNLVGVFVDTPAKEINVISERLQLDLVQLHGDQDSLFADKIQRPYVKAIRVINQDTIAQELDQHPKAQGFLLDTYSKSAYGGTGHAIPQHFLPKPLPARTILAGGINVENIHEALALQPYAIDINSGVESSPANKDIAKLKEIMLSVCKFDEECRESEC